MKSSVNYILLDAANTIIHKPLLWNRIIEVLERYDIKVDIKELKLKHKLLSEIIRFPDVTSKEFYNNFNAELCRLLGVVPTACILDDIFENCKYLPWEQFDDCKYLLNQKVSIGVLSNFNNKLPEILKQNLPKQEIKDVIVSENEGVAKPDVLFYQKAIEKIGLPANQVLYIGDSIKLDIEPALHVGFQVKLIDRDGVYENSPHALRSFKNLEIYG